jgi:cobalt-zinc-cadmium efflux system protein
LAGHAAHPPRDEPRLAVALTLTAGFMLAEAVGGWWSGSLALLADAGHMLTDTAALAVALVAARLARRPPDRWRTYGWRRAEVLAAAINGLALLLIAVGIAWEALARLREPVPILAGAMLAIALAGLAVNIVVFRLLHGGDQASLNLRGATLHVLGDILGSIAVLVAGLVILATGWRPIDPLASLAVTLLILRSAWALVRDAVHVLMEGAPAGLDPPTLARDLERHVPTVIGVHHVHAWSIGGGSPLVSLHATVPPEADQDAVLSAIKARLAERFGVAHSVVQLERDACPDGSPDDDPPDCLGAAIPARDRPAPGSPNTASRGAEQ